MKDLTTNPELENSLGDLEKFSLCLKRVCFAPVSGHYCNRSELVSKVCHSRSQLLPTSKNQFSSISQIDTVRL